LSIIDTREEQEKLNIWTALLNLENLYGTKVKRLKFDYLKIEFFLTELIIQHSNIFIIATYCEENRVVKHIFICKHLICSSFVVLALKVTFIRILLIFIYYHING